MTLVKSTDLKDKQLNVDAKLTQDMGVNTKEETGGPTLYGVPCAHHRDMSRGQGKLENAS